MNEFKTDNDSKYFQLVLLLVCACDKLASCRLKKGSCVEKDNSIVVTGSVTELLGPSNLNKDENTA